MVKEAEYTPSFCCCRRLGRILPTLSFSFAFQVWNAQHEFVYQVCLWCTLMIVSRKIEVNLLPAPRSFSTSAEWWALTFCCALQLLVCSGLKCQVRFLLVMTIITHIQGWQTWVSDTWDHDWSFTIVFFWSLPFVVWLNGLKFWGNQRRSVVVWGS